MKRLLVPSLLALASAALADQAGRPAQAGVTGSKHDFTSGGRSTAAVAEAQGPGSRCFYCHASHRAAGGAGQRLSNRPDRPTRAQGYQSTTMAAAPQAISGASRACLSCHDGTVAPGATRTGAAAGANPLAAGAPANLGTDLRGSHPVSIQVAPQAGRLRRPAAGDAVQLDGDGRVQCTSCHDPHAEWGDPDVGQFLVKPVARSGLCNTCHDVGGAGAAGAHATSASAWTDPVTGRTRTLAEAGCAACHRAHGAHGALL